ncbi:MAPEG family protein [Niveibacterium umoris]|uniref:Putative MAPEG superfamily protein n=1 Tax=Niveibacterium umoris TaxID=1193620 RepID=A0A840BTQ8_9RHOO|nr:MAPEG family protein [Niveibacterium umoris]MBB4014196.1 putative MAPEG superfamily protein [Niveibacterium umoris]
MKISFLCVLIAAIQPFLWALAAKAGGIRSGTRYNNHTPRNTLASLTGWPQRANWAQQNSFEAFPFFAAAVLMAHVAGVAPALIDTWAITFIVARFAYFGCYVADLATVRSLVWFVGVVACARLMLAAA